MSHCWELRAAGAGYESPCARDNPLHPSTAVLTQPLTQAWVVGFGFFFPHLNDERRSVFARLQASSRLQLWRLSAWSSYPT